MMSWSSSSSTIWRNRVRRRRSWSSRSKERKSIIRRL